VAVASAGPYANLHIAPDRQPRKHRITQFFTGRMPSLLPNQQLQSTEGKQLLKLLKQITTAVFSMMSSIFNSAGVYSVS